jgi:hypothetical protein
MKNKIDPKYLGIPNICFSLTEKDDNREPEYLKQRLKYGFDNSELWSLDSTIACFILPRLKRFRKIAVGTGHPARYEKNEWSNIVDKIIEAFEILASDDSYISTDEQDKIIDEGLKLFAENFRSLWY